MMETYVFKGVTVPSLDHDAMMESKYRHKVRPEGRMERRIVAALIHHMEQRGWRAHSVFDGDERTEVTDAKSAMELIFNLDEASLRFVLASEWDKPRVVDEGWGGRLWTDDPHEHGVLLILGNGTDIISDWNYYVDDRDGFNAAMDAFDSEEFA